MAAITREQFERLLQAMPKPPPLPPPASGLGNPGPLGLGAFAMTTFILSVFNTGAFMDPRAERAVLPLALFYGGVAQFIAGLYEYSLHNTFGATAFCSYGAFWCMFAGWAGLVAPALAASGVSTAHPTGLLLLGWLIFTVYMTVAAVRVSVVVGTVFTTLTLAFALLTAGALGASPTATAAGGWVGIICAFSAWYGSAAVVINSSWGYTVLPVGVHVVNPPKKVLEELVKGEHCSRCEEDGEDDTVNPGASASASASARVAQVIAGASSLSTGEDGHEH